MFLIWQCITISHHILLIWFGLSKRAYWQCVCVSLIPSLCWNSRDMWLACGSPHRIHKNKHVCPRMLWPTKQNIMCWATSDVDSKHFSRTFILLLDTPLRRAQWKWFVWWYYSTLWPWTILAWLYSCVTSATTSKWRRGRYWEDLSLSWLSLLYYT